MKKGCLGCLGCGCLLVLIAIILPLAYGYHWANTDGRKYLAEGVQKLSEGACKFAFEPESAAEIASMTKEIKEDVIKGDIGIVDSWNYFLNNMKENEKLQGQVIFAVLYRNLKGKITSSKGEKPVLIDDEGAEAVRTIMYAMSQGKIDIKSATSNIAPLLDDKNKVRYQNGYGTQFESKNVKNNITKEDMEKVVKALKEYVKANNLETPDEKVTPDSLAKEEVIKFLDGLKKLKKK